MILLENITKKYEDHVIFKNLNLEIKKNSFVAITGKSGSGKTTLLNIIGLLNKPSEGDVYINGVNKFDKRIIQDLRRYFYGYIFQDYGLLENENVEKNLLFSSKFTSNITKQKLIDTLKQVDISEEFLSKKVYLLSGGEQQRIAIARIMLKPCELILADEPTGNLDEENTAIVLKLLKQFVNQGKTVICVTHDEKIAQSADERFVI